MAPDTVATAKHGGPWSASSKAYRKRRRLRIRCLTIRIPQTEIDRLEAEGYLDTAQRADRKAQAEAVETFITDYLPP